MHTHVIPEALACFLFALGGAGIGGLTTWIALRQPRDARGRFKKPDLPLG